MFTLVVRVSRDLTRD